MSKMIASAKIGETLNPQIVALAKLGLTDAEIQQVLEDDKRIDRGEKLFELSDEQKQAEKKARQADRTPTVYKFQKRERKADEDKAKLMNALFTAILPMCDTYEVTNAEREFCFTYHERKFKVVLSAPRS